ncbi:MAG: glycosyltransferase family 2 protein [Chthoniobacterales bacterium]
MDLQEITPMVLCYNEHENIRRCLTRLAWAKQVIVLDEGSTDGSHDICNSFPNVRIEHLPSGLSLAEKCDMGLKKITTEWVLSLDSDYMVPEDFVKEMERLTPTDSISGYRVPFKLAFFGRQFPNSLYPPRSVLYRPKGASYVQDGHAHRVQISGEIVPLEVPLVHDDRKSIGRWFNSQSRYAQEEAEKLYRASPDGLPLQDRFRRMIVVAPILVIGWTFIVKGMAWRGRSGLYYGLMRVCAEVMLSVALLDRLLRDHLEKE